MSKKDKISWHDKKTPKICGTCVSISQLGDGTFICLKQSRGGSSPFLLSINPYNNARGCQYWQKGGEVYKKDELSEKDLKRLKSM